MKKNILIVEDHELTRFGLKTTFENVDFVENLYEADSAETAIQIFNNNNIILLFITKQQIISCNSYRILRKTEGSNTFTFHNLFIIIQDIRRLKLIYMFRKLDMPLEEIQQILDGRKDLQEALEQQKEQLRQKQQKLAAALSFCGEIQETE